jgi:predicted Holliday junction resolvase-like endonuclease
MDLTLLIVLVFGALLIMHMINTIRSLTEEIKEMKHTCMNDQKLEKTTRDPIEKFNTDLIANIKYFQDFFDKK